MIIEKLMDTHNLTESEKQIKKFILDQKDKKSWFPPLGAMVALVVVVVSPVVEEKKKGV